MTFTEEKSDPQPNQTEQIAPEAWEERYKRLAAEIENLKKRLTRNAVQRVEEQRDQLMVDMLPLADNLERILTFEQTSKDCQRLAEGVALTLRAFQAVLKKYGVETIEAQGKPFDPNYHEAAGVVPSSQHPEGMVVEVVQNGYLRNDHVLRPAKVLVSAA